MLNKSFLLDNFEVSGTRVDDFIALIKAIDKQTVAVQQCLNKLVVVSIKDSAMQASDDISEWYLNPVNPSNDGNLELKTIPKSYMLSEWGEALFEETIKKNPTMLWNEGEKVMWFLSSIATNTMAQRIGVTGKSIREHSLERDLFIARKFNVNVTATLIIRRYDNVMKVFSMMSQDFVHSPLYTLCKIYYELAGESKLGPMECECWNITHKRTKISFLFKEYTQNFGVREHLKHEMIPGIEMTTSDVGESSYVIRGYWKTPKGAIVYDHTFSRRHRGEVDSDAIAARVRTQILDKYDILSKRLGELTAIDITPPELNLQGARDSGKNHKMICNAFHSVFKQLELVSTIGKKRLMSLERCIDYSIIRDDRHYTAYDIVMDVFELPQSMHSHFEEEGVSAEMVRKFREETSKAAYVDFGKKEDITGMMRETVIG